MFFDGFLFDIYNFEEEIHLWVISQEHKIRHFTDRYYPVIYVDGSGTLLKNFVLRIIELDALHCEPCWVTRKHFYKNEPVRVLGLTISRPSILRKIRSKLYAFYRRMDIYHSDIEVPTGYMFSRGIFPLSKVRVQANHKNQIMAIHSLNKITDIEYDLPPLKKMKMFLQKSHRLGLSSTNPIQLEIEDREYILSEPNTTRLIYRLNEIMMCEDPDVILSAYGDQIIFPHLFKMAQQKGISLLLDRDSKPGTTRKIITKGSTYNTYGSWIYRAPSYPLFGRWHIDSANSFVFKEAQLFGILELARLSRIPVQRLARSSTGTALTAIETHVALKNNYLVPWQKSSVEESKTCYELLKIDKGGLIFVPDTRESLVYENVAQMDFSQMYPGIMVNHNISPECVRCLCCRNGEITPKVPEAGYHICIKRKGVVSQALEHVLDRRRYYKQRLKDTKENTKDIYDAKQNALKWMLVTSFGYLGYRNAKFGRIESHESVTAYGREKLLVAKEVAENNGYSILHAITDCLFIRKQKSSPLEQDELQKLGKQIQKLTGIEMNIDGIYSWVVFLPSRNDKELPVVNRYFGLFRNGELKYKGIAARRKDTPIFIRNSQLSLLEMMRQKNTIEALQSIHSNIHREFCIYDEKIKEGIVPWKQLLMSRTVSKEMNDYQVANATFLSLQQLHNMNLTVQAGEKIKYVVLSQNHNNPECRFISEELATLEYNDKLIAYDILYYRKLWWESYKEIWQYFAPTNYFARMPEAQGYLF